MYCPARGVRSSVRAGASPVSPAPINTPAAMQAAGHRLCRPYKLEVTLSDTRELLRDMYSKYQADVGLDPQAQYLHGTPLRPVVPLDTAVGGLFILGAYPSARFVQIGRISDVPVADNLGPFENERWFDGVRIRKQPSAREVHDLFLTPLGISRSCCWITDLVKVFLFKTGHKKRYAGLDATPPSGYERERFAELAKKSIPWLERELEAAKPKLMITLGREVAGVLHGVTSPTAQNRLLNPDAAPMRFGRIEVPVVHCAHPGILMRRGPRNPWPDRHDNEFIPALRRAVDDIRGA